MGSLGGFKRPELMRTDKTTQTVGKLSTILFGVFFSVVFTVIWFLPILRNLPFGEDSPTACGAPLGFFIGCSLARRFLSKPLVCRTLIGLGALISLISGVCFFHHYSSIKNSQEFQGVYHLLGCVAYLAFLIGGFALFLSASLQIYRHWRSCE